MHISAAPAGRKRKVCQIMIIDTVDSSKRKLAAVASASLRDQERTLCNASLYRLSNVRNLVQVSQSTLRYRRLRYSKSLCKSTLA